MRGDLWHQRSVFVTGHTGFKGSWLSLCLQALGARVSGYALTPPSSPNLFELADVASGLSEHVLADVRDADRLAAAMAAAQPEVVFHLAAQPLVRASYRDPGETWSTNVMGTVNLLEAVRRCPSVRAVVVVTTDKCYENREWEWGYRESDRLGGHDPYAASKAAAELVVQSHRRSFFQAGGPLVATARAGNVIGGGDFSEDRLLADLSRAAASGRPVVIRNPNSTRPWQHVLDGLLGYLFLAKQLLAGRSDCATAFNFGPANEDNLSVAALLERLKPHWPALVWTEAAAPAAAPHESTLLYLDSTLARERLGWRPHWGLERALQQTALWYSGWLAGEDLAALTRQQLKLHLENRHVRSA